jgi:uncharacterized protein YdhG (YjbR/CyaY superfamily)
MRHCVLACPKVRVGCLAGRAIARVLSKYCNAFSDHCSLFPGAGPTIEFKNELKNFQTSKGTIRFAPNKPLAAALLKRLVRARVAENERKKGR